MAKTMSLPNHKGLRWFHWLVISLSLLLTIGAWHLTTLQVEEKIAQRFDNESEQVVELIKERMRKYEDALWSGVAVIHSQNHDIDSIKWRRFAETLHIETKYPGINGIGVIYQVLPDELPGYLKQERTLRPDYHIHPPHKQREYWPITYIEPVAPNKKAVGLDMAHETNRFTAAKKARDTGTAQITGPITLVQDSEKTPGFLFYVPFYEAVDTMDEQQRRTSFGGLVYAPFIMHKLIEGTLANQKRLVNISIRDGADILYDEHVEGKEDYDANPLFARTVQLEIYGRPWQIRVQSAKSFRDIAQSHQPIIVLLSGLCIEVLLITFFILLMKANKKAVAYAKKMAEQASLVLESAPDGILSVNDKGVMQSANPALCELFGYTEKELIGCPVSILIEKERHEQHAKDVSNYVATGMLKKNMAVGRVVLGFHKDGTAIPLEISLNKAEKADGSAQVIAVVKDVSERESLIEKLSESNAELEKFAYVASHDLQEPLRMVTNFTRLLERKYAEGLNDEAKHYIDLACTSAERMQMLIEDLLEYARLGVDTQAIELVNCESVMEFVLSNLSERIASTQANVTHGAMPTLTGSPIRLTRLLQNLISNAIKYQPEGAHPAVHVAVDESAEAWTFCVSDNGIGMKQEYCKQIFKPFNRLHHKHEYAGTGIGLAICQKIVDQMRGEIWAESIVGQGSKFYFTVPKVES